MAEVLLKYETICTLAVLSIHDASEAASVGFNLVARESLGQWQESLRNAVTAMTGSGTSGTQVYTRAFTQAIGDQSKSDTVNDAMAVWNEIGQSEFRLTKTRIGLFEFFVALRNRTRGHGAPLQRQYETINDPVIRLLEMLATTSPFAQQQLVSPVKLKKTDAYACRILRGVTPQEHVSVGAQQITHSKSLYLYIDDCYIQLPDLLRYHHDDDGCFLLNSSRKKTGLYELLDYFSNQRSLEILESYAAPPARKPKSATAGVEVLDDASFPLHNLPRIDFLNYVARPQLEQELNKLVNGKTTNVISLGGEGGIGKTTLALRVARSVASSGMEQDVSPFDYIIWFSARDVDLNNLGPARRDRQVTSLLSCASFFRSIVEPVEPIVESVTDLEYFALLLSGGRPRFLLIFDNFESFDDISALQEFLRDNLVFPSKVLITSRERNFEGDRQIRVPGLLFQEGRDLVSRTARQVGCEPSVLDERRVITIHERTNGNPYAIKLVVNELANGTAFDRIFERALNERYLTTLFRRSFERLEESAQYLFLLICLSETGRREELARLCCVGRGFDYEAAKEALIRHSLIDVPMGPEDGWTVYRLSWAAQEFARASLTGTVSQRIVEDDVAFLDSLSRASAGNGNGIELFDFIGTNLNARTPFGADRSQRIVEFLVSSDPTAAARHALELYRSSQRSSFEKRAAFKTALGLNSLNAELWHYWSLLEEREGDYKRSLDLALRAVDSEDGVNALERVGRHIIRLISDAAEQFPGHERRLYTGSIIERLETNRDELDADALTTLGRLHLISFQTEAALAAANSALALDDRNGRARDLARRAMK